jgi:hypothetical protein
MKLHKLFIALSLFLGGLEANDPTPKTDPVVIFDCQEQIKQMIISYTMDSSAPILQTEWFCEGEVSQFLSSLSELEKKQWVERLYTLGLCVEILHNPEEGLFSEKVNECKLFLENEYQIKLPIYPCLESLNDEERFDFAYLLLLANGAAYLDASFETQHCQKSLTLTNLSSPHSQRMLLTLYKSIAFISLEQASTLFSKNSSTQELLESLSSKLYKSTVSITECADAINHLCQSQIN